MYKYEVDQTRIVGATERTCDAGLTRDGRTDGRTEGNQYTLPPKTSLCGKFVSLQSELFEILPSHIAAGQEVNAHLKWITHQTK